MLKIFTYACGSYGSKFISIQHKSLKRHLKDEFEYTVFNTCGFDHNHQSIQETCHKLGDGIRHIAAPTNITTGSHPSGLIYSWREHALKEPRDLLLMIDYDMGLMQPFSVAEFMDGVDIAGLGQSRSYVKGGENIHYLWPGFLFWNMKTIPAPHEINLDGGRVDNIPVDVAGQLCYWLRAHPEIKSKSTSLSRINAPKNEELPEKFRGAYENEFGMEIMNGFLHFRAGSNWMHMPNDWHERKLRFYESIFE